MTNAHYHRNGDTYFSFRGKEYRFYGTHPWFAEGADLKRIEEELADKLGSDEHAGVGEIGLDRLKTKYVTDAQRELFEMQLRVAAKFGRPVVLHGAKCWGEVVKCAKAYASAIPAFLFHGFSRSDGLFPEIFAMNGFIGVGKAILNDHAVNYRKMVTRIPVDRLLVETDDDTEDEEAREKLLAEIFAKTAELTAITKQQLEDSAKKFFGWV